MIPLFEDQSYKIADRFGDYNVYAISDTRVARCINNWSLLTKKELSEETPSDILQYQKAHLEKILATMDEAYDKGTQIGLNVPKPYGIYGVKIIDPSKKFSTLFKPAIVPALVIERIYGQFPYTILDPEEYKLSQQKLDEQISLAEQIGFEPLDSKWPNNSLWNHKDEKITIIDYDQWEKRVKQEIYTQKFIQKDDIKPLNIYK